LTLYQSLLGESLHEHQSQPLGWVFFYDSFEADRMLKTYF